jgi:hypothetical protein
VTHDKESYNRTGISCLSLSLDESKVNAPENNIKGRHNKTMFQIYMAIWSLLSMEEIKMPF